MPLPKPREDESRSEFVERCMVDNVTTSEFNTINQRYAVCNDLYSEKRELKQIGFNRRKFRNAYSKSFIKQYKIASKRNLRLSSEYYKKGFKNSIKEFLKSNSLDGQSYILYFQNSDTEAMFMDIYVKTSLQFYNWYLDHYRKFIKKNFPSENNMEYFITNYVQYSGRLAQKISSVQKTAIKNVTNIFGKMLNDQNFVNDSIEGRSRRLSKILDKRAVWEARRIVVTETTLSSNLGAEKGALTAFKKEELLKDWIQGFSMNHREGHEILSSQDPIPMGENFVNPVTGNSLRIPGEGPSSEVINCSCYAAYIPRPDVFG